MRLKTLGPRRAPAMIYPTIRGDLRSFAPFENMSAAMSDIPRKRNIKGVVPI